MDEIKEEHRRKGERDSVRAGKSWPIRGIDRDNIRKSIGSDNEMGRFQ